MAIHYNEENARSGERMEESISNINTVKAIAGENAIRKKIMDHYHKVFGLDIEQHALRSIYQLAVDFFSSNSCFSIINIWRNMDYKR